MSMTVIVALIAVGFLFLLLEILVVPGATVVGITGFILMAIGIWQGYAVYGTPEGHYILSATIFLAIVVLAFALRSKTWKKAMLDSEILGRANAYEEESVKAGDTGKAIHALFYRQSADQ